MRTPSHHLSSLDAFRGMTIAGMVLVNNPGNWSAVFDPLVHAGWNGLTAADLVFPWFLLILGAAASLAFARRIGGGARPLDLHLRIARRTAILVLLGLVLNAVAVWPALDTIRLPGVLQRIGLVYAIAALVTVHSTGRQRWLVLAVLLVGHWAILALPTPGTPRFDLSIDHNVAAAIDRAVFGRHVLGSAVDPEGLLGTMSAVATALIGTLAGDALQRMPTAPERRLAMGGVASMAVGYAWSFALPMNKVLWTPSYALFTAGAGLVALAVFVAVLDAPRHADAMMRILEAAARPLVWLGLNPIAVYFGSELARQLLDRPLLRAGGQLVTGAWLIWNALRSAVPDALDDRWVALAYALLFVSGWTAVAGVMNRYRVRLHV